MKNKNIILATGIYPPDIGGPATYVKFLEKELPKFGFKVKVVSYGEGKTNDNIYFVSRRQNIFLRYFKYFWQIWKNRKWADVVFIQGPVSEGLPGMSACVLGGKKFILKIVGDYAWEQGKQRFGVKDNLDDFQKNKYNFKVEFFRFVEKLVVQKAFKIIVPSEYLKKIVSMWGVSKEKIKVIYNASKKIDLKFSKQEAKNKLNIKGDIILSVGRLVPWKGFDVLLEVMPGLLKINNDFKLFIIGDGPDLKKIEDKIKKLNLSSSVFLTKNLQQEKLWLYMQSAECFVLNTAYEGLSHVIIEAMQNNLPVISTNVGGNPELIENNKNGILVDYNNKEELKKAILYLCKNTEKKKEFINNSRRILDKFTYNNMIKDLLKILE